MPSLYNDICLTPYQVFFTVSRWGHRGSFFLLYIKSKPREYERMLVKSRKRESTIVKTLGYDGENAKVRRKVEITISNN